MSKIPYILGEKLAQTFYSIDIGNNEQRLKDFDSDDIILADLIIQRSNYFKEIYKLNNIINEHIKEKYPLIYTSNYIK